MPRPPRPLLDDQSDVKLRVLVTRAASTASDATTVSLVGTAKAREVRVATSNGRTQPERSPLQVRECHWPSRSYKTNRDLEVKLRGLDHVTESSSQSWRKESRKT